MLLLLAAGLRVAVAFEDDELTEPTIAIMGVLGERVNLPCDIHPNTSDDEVSLVLWYKDDSTTPIYSADARKTSLRKAHHAPADWLAHRAYLKTEASPSVLQMSPLQEGDEGLYRCRVDFKKARTRNYQVQLKVILPPNDPIITDQNGEILPTKSVIGPYNEGDKLVLICQVEGGNPPPVVTWWRESFLLEDHYNVSNGISKSVLEIRALTRNDLMATLTCMASNNNISFPVSASVIVDLNFRPLSVWIQGEQRPLSAGKPVTLECRASGSRPPAVIEWWKGGTRMNSTSHNGTSALTFVPTADDSGKHVSCRAENPLIANSRIEDGVKIQVHYIPILNLRLGSKLRHQHIQEGNDVFFECDIRANPWVNDIGWRFEGKEVHTNTSAGVIVSNQSLVLQKVDLRSRGKYTCTATNSQGIGESNAVMLKVRYAPVCAKDQKTTYGAARNEAVRILCELEGDPSEIAFKWRFNNSKEPISSSNVHTDGTRSWLTVVPQTEDDYGAIVCWGKNNIGLQREPCVFQLIPAGPPEPVHNCSIVNQTEESLTVACHEGYDGGIEQTFHMELHDAEQRILHGNYSLAAATIRGSSAAAAAATATGTTGTTGDPSSATAAAASPAVLGGAGGGGGDNGINANGHDDGITNDDDGSAPPGGGPRVVSASRETTLSTLSSSSSSSSTPMMTTSGTLPGTTANVVMSASGLTPATAYVVAVWASNARGQSPPTMLVAHTIPSPISLTRRGMWHLTLSPLLLLLISVAAGIVLVAFIIILIMKIRTRQVIKNSAHKRVVSEDKSQHPLQMEERNMTDLAHSPYRDEEKCPDVIPPEPLIGCRQEGRVLDSSTTTATGGSSATSTSGLATSAASSVAGAGASAGAPVGAGLISSVAGGNGVSGGGHVVTCSLVGVTTPQGLASVGSNGMIQMVGPGQPGGPLCTGTLKKGASWDSQAVMAAAAAATTTTTMGPPPHNGHVGHVLHAAGHHHQHHPHHPQQQQQQQQQHHQHQHQQQQQQQQQLQQHQQLQHQHHQGGPVASGASSSISCHPHMATLPRHDSLHLSLHSPVPEWRESSDHLSLSPTGVQQHQHQPTIDTRYHASFDSGTLKSFKPYTETNVP